MVNYWPTGGQLMANDGQLVANWSVVTPGSVPVPFRPAPVPKARIWTKTGASCTISRAGSEYAGPEVPKPSQQKPTKKQKPSNPLPIHPPCFSV